MPWSNTTFAKRALFCQILAPDYWMMIYFGLFPVIGLGIKSWICIDLWYIVLGLEEHLDYLTGLGMILLYI